MRVVITLFCLIALGSAQAQNFNRDDVNAMLVFKKEFDGGSNDYDKSLKLGFSVNHSHGLTDRMGRLDLMSPNTLHRPLVDIEYSFKTRYFSKFNLGGVDALTYRTVLNQNGEPTRWPMGLSTTQMIIGGVVVVAGGYFLISEVIADGSDDDDDDQVPQ